MKKIFLFLFIATLAMAGISSCGGNKEPEQRTKELTYDASLSEGDFSNIFAPSSTGILKVEDNSLRVKFEISELNKSDKIVDYDNAYLKLFDDNGVELFEFHVDNGLLDLNKALETGDKAKCDSIEFFDFMAVEEANGIADKAVSFALIFPMVDPSVIEERYSKKTSTSSNSSSTTESLDDEMPQSPNVRKCIEIVMQQVKLAAEYPAASTDRKIEIIKKYKELNKEDSRIFYDVLKGPEVSEYHKFRDKIIEDPEIEPLWKNLKEAVKQYNEKGTVD